MKKQPRRTPWPARLVKWGSVISLLIIGGQAALSVGTIECKLTTEKDCPPEIMDSLEEIKGQALLFNNLEEKLNLIKFNHPAQIKVTAKRLPKTIYLQVAREAGLYQIKNSSKIVTKSGFVFESTQENIVIIELPANSYEPKPDPLIHQNLVTLLESFSSRELEVTSISWQSSDKIHVHLANGLTVALNLEAVPTAGEKLKLILAENTISNLDLSGAELDLRFRLPVLRNVN